jgi:hypothetical protein
VTEKIRILFLAANPKDTTQLRLDEEIREIQAKIRAAEFRDSSNSSPDGPFAQAT